MDYELAQFQEILKSMQSVMRGVKMLENKLPPDPSFSKVPGATKVAEDICKEIQIVRDVSSNLDDMNDKLKAIETICFGHLGLHFSLPPIILILGVLEFSERAKIEGKMKEMLPESVSHHLRT